MEYFDTLPVEVDNDCVKKCFHVVMKMNRDCVRSILYQVAKIRESTEEFSERVRCMAVRAFPSLGRAGVELYAVEFFPKGLGNKRTSLAVLDKAPDSIGRAVDWVNKLEANVSWVGEDSKAMIVEECHMAGSCPMNVWSKNGNNWFKGKNGVVFGVVEERVLDLEKVIM